MDTESLTLFRFSPEKIPQDTLRELFVGREKQLDNLVDDVGKASKEHTTRFHLIVGPRGIGKSHLMVLAYYDLIEKYGSTVIPIKFAEEEYSIYRASDLFLRALEEYDKTYGRVHTDIPKDKGEDFILDFALGKLEQISREEKKQFVFLIENLNEIFLQLEKDEVAKLRSIFQRYDIFSVVASAPMIFPGVSEHDEPFFNFFKIDHLREFSLAESKQFMRRIGEVEKNEYFLQNFEKFEPKLEGIYHLTGGSPRLVLIIYEIIHRGNIENIETIFLKMLDDHTPYYQKIFEMLSGQRRVIVDTLMLSPTPLTPKDIAEKTRIDGRTVNSQLRRLENDRYVRSHSIGKRTCYEVRERLFRLWREMRQPFGRNRIPLFIDFLTLWYTPEEREKIFRTKFERLEAGDTSVLRGLHEYHEGLVVADTIFEGSPESFGTLVRKLMMAYNLKKREETVVLADRLYPQADKIGPDSIYPYTLVLLSLGFDEYREGNYGYGKKHISRAYEIESKRSEEFDLKNDTIELLKEIIDTGDPELVRMVADTIIEAKGDKDSEYRRFMKPITDALMIIETGNTSLYYLMLQSEERDLIADIVKKIMKSDALSPDV
ncbi:transcriptional regulator [Methanofollis aquaemaris]|uniref:Transcriptional regulator n=1 Tax=Methanofollis aquaemaris TaxID=126734 RepID=A0A8A3S0U2_9EURY|nr:AAA family ATPase [Methanofollis aquaemaris]QSZ66207.1 transcriptional regulator [Methanofollis aquaemaris]